MRLIRGGPLQAWEKVGDPQVLAKKYGLALFLQRMKNPATLQEEEFSSFTKSNGLTACAVTQKGGLLLIREYAQATDAFVYKFPAGVPKPGENALEVAGNEVREETGYQPARVTETTSDLLWLGPRKSPSGFRTFAALDCCSVGDQQLDAGEAAIEVYEVSVSEFWSMFRAGEIRAVETVVAAFLAAMHGLIPFPERAELLS